MLTTKDFEKRANQLFESCRDRWKKKLQKGLPKGVILDIAPEAVLPFTRRQVTRLHRKSSICSTTTKLRMNIS